MIPGGLGGRVPGIVTQGGHNTGGGATGEGGRISTGVSPAQSDKWKTGLARGAGRCCFRAPKDGKEKHFLNFKISFRSSLPI